MAMAYPGAQTRQQFVGILLLALAYVLLGRLSLQLALPPGYATALFLPAGLALAYSYSSRMRLLPGVLLGAFILNLLQAFPQHGWQTKTLLAPLTIAIASTLQAWLGARLLQKFAHDAMDQVRDVLVFLCGIPLVCVTSASLSVLALSALGMMQPNQFQENWLAWWVGDSIGALLLAPLLWLWCAQPRALWRSRRYMLGATVLCGSLLSVLIYDKTSHWERAQQLRQVHLHAQKISDGIQARFGEHERFLHVATVIFDDDDHILSRMDFDLLAEKWLRQHPEVYSMYWAPRLAREQRAALEQQLSREYGMSYRIKTREDNGDMMMPVVYLSPLAHRPELLGKDLLADPAHADTVRHALQSKSVMACPPRLVGKTPWLQWMHIAVSPIPSRQHNPQSAGLLGIALNMNDWLGQIFSQEQYRAYRLRVTDITPDNPPLQVFDTLKGTHPDDFVTRFRLADRMLELRINANPEHLYSQQGWESWIVLALCLLMTCVLSGTMLILSGEQARTYQLVKERTNHLQEREARLQAILHHATDAILSVADDNLLISANQAARQMFGLQEQDIGQRTLCDLLVHDAHCNMALLLQRFRNNEGQDLVFTGRQPGGHTFPLALAISRVELAHDHFYVCIMRDLTEQQRAQEKIHHLAHHDPLTGLANRITLNLRLEQLLAISRRNQQGVAVMFIDIDHFKKINDTQGHQIGDQFLLEVARRLQESVREADTIARFGGDEFICVLPEQHSADHVTMVATRIVQILSMPYLLQGLTLHSGASVGIAMFPNDGEDVKTLLKNADTAMYAAKSQGRGNFQFFSPAMNVATHERLMLENRLWEALEHQEFELFLQPQIALQDNTLIGAEALIRWRHPDLGLVPPDKFIPVAEDSALIHPLGEWVLQRAIQLIASWQGTPLQKLRLALNLSARQCQISSLLPVLDRLLHEAGVAGSHLEMEITETAAMSDPEQTRELLRALRQRGIQVAIDDFGTGYSSLSYLKLFAIDRIKIDRSFVKDIESDPNDAVIVAATIALAHSLGLEVIAEGVESAAQCEFLRDRGCDEVQGYYFAKPLPLIDFIAFAQAHASRYTT